MKSEHYYLAQMAEMEKLATAATSASQRAGFLRAAAAYRSMAHAAAKLECDRQQAP